MPGALSRNEVVQKKKTLFFISKDLKLMKQIKPHNKCYIYESCVDLENSEIDYYRIILKFSFL